MVMVFHGGGALAKRCANFTGFNDISEKHGFIAVYPQGINKHWNDGRRSEKFYEQDKKIDDVAFVAALLKNLKAEFNIDENRVYATGMSNGGIFCQRLAIEQSRRFAAVASVTAQIAQPLADSKPGESVSVLIMNGTRDPFVPYGGGEVTPVLFPGLARLTKRLRPGRGRVISTDATIRFWIKHNRIKSPAFTEKLPDIVTSDDASIERKVWFDTTTGLRVVLYKINGGGHTYPGHRQYLPRRIIGTTCQDINASEAIWQFFAKHSKNKKTARPRVPADAGRLRR